MTTTYVMNVIGQLWMGGLAAYTYQIRDPSKDEDPEQKLLLQASDFQSLKDYEITRITKTIKGKGNRTAITIDEEIIKDWDSEENHILYCECMFPDTIDDEEDQE